MEGGYSTATTYIRPYKVAAGKTAIQTMEERFAYGLNPKKLGAVSAYLCDPTSAPAEFLLLKSQYQRETSRAVEHGALFFQIRQAFPPGEVTPEEANKIGYETAMRWTKGKYQFFVCTHIDKGHIHNHIYYNSTAQDCSRKFHNFIGSSFAVRRLSDRVCLEHDLSVIQNPKLHSQGHYLHYGQWLGGDRRPSQKEQLRAVIDAILTERPADLPAFLAALEASGVQVIHGRGGVLSFQLPGFARPARWRSSTLGAVVQYAKTRPVFDGYKAAKYSKKYLAQHEAELADYREAKATMNDLLDGAKLPKMDALKQKCRELTERKKALTAQYRAAQKEMRELVTAKGNIDHLINLTGGRADKEQTR